MVITPTTAPILAPITIDTSYNIEEFVYFQPDLPVDIQHPDGDIIIVGKDIIYRDINAFCGYIQDAIARKDIITVRDNLHLCLRGDARL